MKGLLYLRIIPHSLNSTNVFKKSLIDRYEHRPRSLQSMSLAEFAAIYATNYRVRDDDESDALPSTYESEDTRACSLQEGSEILTDVAQQMLQDNTNILNASEPSNAMLARFESAANEYRQLVRALNVKQRAVFLYHRNWCKETVTRKC